MTGFRHQHAAWVLALTFWFAAAYGWHSRPSRDAALPYEVFDRVVVPAPLQIALAGGDRFLAGSFEAIRALAAPSDSPDAVGDNMSFAIRARLAVANLNACHEDNYYFANALLTWGGAYGYGNEVLRQAANCRVWDEFPPFYYGFNTYYFERDIAKATLWINEAANRSTTNASALRKLAIMLNAERMQDDEAALSYLTAERDQARDAKLREMLDKRVQRLRGLIQLKQAQHTYEQRFGTPLTDPHALIQSGILATLPSDPLRIGYDFSAKGFRMREITMPAMSPTAK